MVAEILDDRWSFYPILIYTPLMKLMQISATYGPLWPSVKHGNEIQRLDLIKISYQRRNTNNTLKQF